jgi:predicted Kef-type K+ transport protein
LSDPPFPASVAETKRKFGKTSGLSFSATPMHAELYAIAAAYLAGLAAASAGLPPLVGYLIAGYFLHYLGIPLTETIARLSDLGIELLMFTVGLKLSWKSLFRREVIGVGGLHMLIVTALTALGFLWLDRHVTGGLLLGVSLSFSSTVLAVKILEDNAELLSLHGRIALGILIFQDVVAVGVLAFAEGVPPTPWASVLLAFPAVRLAARRFFSASGDDELKLLFGVLLAVGGGEIATQVGVSETLGALWMGALLAGHPGAKKLSERMWSLKEIFLIAFFVQIGQAGLPDRGQLITALQLILLLPAQGIMFFLMFVFLRLRARTAFITAVALTTYSEFALITTRIVIDSGLLPTQWNIVMGVAVAVSLALAAPMNRFSHRVFGWLEPFLIRFERGGRHPDHTPTRLGAAQWLVIGMGRTGTAAYKALERRGHPVLGLDADPTRLAKHRQQGRRVLYGDAEDPDLWENLGLKGLLGVVLSLPELDVRRGSLHQLRHRGFMGVIGTTAYSPDEDQLLRAEGANVLLHPLDEAGERLVGLMEQVLHS